MTSMKLYTLLRKIPNTSDSEVQEVASEVTNTNEVATKADLAKLETKLELKVEQVKAHVALWSVGAVITIVIAIFLK